LANYDDWGQVLGPVRFLDVDNLPTSIVARITVADTVSGKDVRCTIWDNYDVLPELERGQWVALEGKKSTFSGESKEGEPRTYYNMDVRNLTVLSPQVVRREREVVNKKAPESRKASF
jgi:hypothetical protein